MLVRINTLQKKEELISKMKLTPQPKEQLAEEPIYQMLILIRIITMQIIITILKLKEKMI